MGFLFVHVYDPFHYEVVKRLSSKIPVSHVCTYYPDLCKPLERKGITVIDSKSFFSNMDPFKGSRLSRRLSAQVLKEYEATEMLFYKLVDRFFHEPVSLNRQKNYYLRLLSHFLDFFEKEKITGVYFESTPHQGWDNILYAVAKKKNVRTYILARTLIQDRMLLVEDYTDIEKAPSYSHYGSTKDDVLNAIKDEELKRRIYKESSWIKYSDEVNKHVSNYSFFKIFSYVNKKIRKDSLRVFLKKLARFMRKDELRPVTYSLLKKISLTRKHNRINLRLKRYYQGLCEPVDYKRKYVFFGLHFQPERSTCPEGEVFENQLLAIHVLSKSVGKDTLIYVKEHPRQVGRDFVNMRSPHFRSKQFYDDLHKMENVRLVDINASSNELIKNAFAVSTVTGSVGWQGLLAKKPALVFGNPWYSGCPSCYRVDSPSSGSQAIRQIGKSTPEDVEKNILAYLAHYQHIFFISSTNNKFARESKKPYDLLVNNLVQELEKRVKGNSSRG